jgi:hypothetical protein
MADGCIFPANEPDEKEIPRPAASHQTNSLPAYRAPEPAKMFAKMSESPPTGTIARLFPAPFRYSTENIPKEAPSCSPARRIELSRVSGDWLRTIQVNRQIGRSRQALHDKTPTAVKARFHVIAIHFLLQLSTPTAWSHGFLPHRDKMQRDIRNP